MAAEVATNTGPPGALIPAEREGKHMTVHQFTTSSSRKVITVEKNNNGSYSAIENVIGGQNALLLSSWCVYWLVETLRNMYLPETLIQEF